MLILKPTTTQTTRPHRQLHTHAYLCMYMYARRKQHREKNSRRTKLKDRKINQEIIWMFLFGAHMCVCVCRSLCVCLFVCVFRWARHCESGAVGRTQQMLDAQVRLLLLIVSRRGVKSTFRLALLNAWQSWYLERILLFVFCWSCCCCVGSNFFVVIVVLVVCVVVMEVVVVCVVVVIFVAVIVVVFANAAVVVVVCFFLMLLLL